MRAIDCKLKSVDDDCINIDVNSNEKWDFQFPETRQSMCKENNSCRFCSTTKHRIECLFDNRCLNPIIESRLHTKCTDATIIHWHHIQLEITNCNHNPYSDLPSLFYRFSFACFSFFLSLRIYSFAPASIRLNDFINLCFDHDIDKMCIQK